MLFVSGSLVNVLEKHFQKGQDFGEGITQASCGFGCNDRTGRDGTIPQRRLFGSVSRVGTGLSHCCPQLSLKIGGTREDARGRPCPGCPATKHTLKDSIEA
jgi:hypothetical protein